MHTSLWRCDSPDRALHTAPPIEPRCPAETRLQDISFRYALRPRHIDDAYSASQGIDVVNEEEVGTVLRWPDCDDPRFCVQRTLEFRSNTGRLTDEARLLVPRTARMQAASWIELDNGAELCEGISVDAQLKCTKPGQVMMTPQDPAEAR